MALKIIESKGEKQTKEVERGISVYCHEQEIIRRIIKRHNNALSQSEFDSIFGNGGRRECTPRERKKYGTRYIDFLRVRYRIWPVAMEAYILGDFNNPGDWSKWLNLLQLMVACGRAYQNGKLPNIIYSIP